jgi:hypothetical protein
VKIHIERKSVAAEIALPTTDAAAAPASAWVRGPAWDGVLMLSALWLAPLALWLAHGYADPASSPLDLLYTALPDPFWVPALVALGFSTAFLHYLLDRAVYRMSDPQVRSAARGLLAPPQIESRTP